MKTLFPAFLLLLCWTRSSHSQLSRSRVGGRCNASSDCVPNADCNLSFCLCKPGFSELSSLECKMDFGGVCSSEADCNNAMGLRCIEAKCQCSQPSETYISELGVCSKPAMKLMYRDVSLLLNQTEEELRKFTMLFNLFMIQSSQPEASASNQNSQNDLFGSGSELNLVLAQRLATLQEELFGAEQNPVPGIQVFLPDLGSSDPLTPSPQEVTEQPVNPPTTISDILAGILAPVPSPTPSSEPDTGAQISPPQVSVPLPPTLAPLSNLFGQIRQNINSLQNAVVNSPLTPTANPNPTPTQTTPANSGFPLQFPPLRVVDDPPPGSGDQGTGGGLTSVIPNLVRSFQQFLPFVRSFNNLLRSSILRTTQTVQAAVGSVQGTPGIAAGNAGIGTGNVNEDRVRGGGGLLTLPLRLLRVPLTVFNNFFGPESTFNSVAQRALRVDFNDRPVRFLPWPFG